MQFSAIVKARPSINMTKKTVFAICLAGRVAQQLGIQRSTCRKCDLVFLSTRERTWLRQHPCVDQRRILVSVAVMLFFVVQHPALVESFASGPAYASSPVATVAAGTHNQKSHQNEAEQRIRSLRYHGRCQLQGLSHHELSKHTPGKQSCCTRVLYASHHRVCHWSVQIQAGQQWKAWTEVSDDFLVENVRPGPPLSSQVRLGRTSVL